MVQPLKDISRVCLKPEDVGGVRWKRLQIHLGLFIVFFLSSAFLAELERKVFFHHFSPAKKNSGKFNTFCVFSTKEATAMAGGRNKSYVANHKGALCFHTILRERFEVKLNLRIVNINKRSKHPRKLKV